MGGPKLTYMTGTAEAAFRPHEAEARGESYGNKLRLTVILPEPHGDLKKVWSARMTIADFLDQLRSVRVEIAKKGLQLDPWEPPALPPELTTP